MLTPGFRVIAPEISPGREKVDYDRQGSFLSLEDAIAPELLSSLQESLPAIDPYVNRSYLPGYKKSGSVSRSTLDQYAPAFAQLYHSSEIKSFVESIVGESVQECPPNDQHAYALYYYTEAGDHIGYHYDTSHYAGKRFTFLLGVVDDSSAKLEYELFRKHEGKTPVKGEASLRPGTIVLFDGDLLYHRVTPIREGERRIVLTMEYVTDPKMHIVRRVISDIKDSIAYFGIRSLFTKR